MALYSINIPRGPKWQLHMKSGELKHRGKITLNLISEFEMVELLLFSDTQDVILQNILLFSKFLNRSLSFKFII